MQATYTLGICKGFDWKVFTQLSEASAVILERGPAADWWEEVRLLVLNTPDINLKRTDSPAGLSQFLREPLAPYPALRTDLETCINAFARATQSAEVSLLALGG
ncbi:MAG: hypothetical protein HC880_20585 [Bacteroidia bacterium]|nr:hypothetical protein [Bacteroidia bacterium]